MPKILKSAPAGYVYLSDYCQMHRLSYPAVYGAAQRGLVPYVRDPRGAIVLRADLNPQDVKRVLVGRGQTYAGLPRR